MAEVSAAADWQIVMSGHGGGTGQKGQAGQLMRALRAPAGPLPGSHSGASPLQGALLPDMRMYTPLAHAMCHVL